MLVQTLITSFLALAPLSTATYTERERCTSDLTKFRDIGCFQENRELLFRSREDQTNMTVGKCTSVCKGNGFRYAAMTYYGVCYCDTERPGFPIGRGACPYKCSGNKTESCGGDGAYSVYKDPTFTSPKSSSQLTRQDYGFVGCFKGKDENRQRLLQFRVEVDKPTFRIRTCINACKEKGFPYAGAENGNECYCGTVFLDSNRSVEDSKCSSLCPVNANQSCGGPNHLNVYRAFDLLADQQCVGNKRIDNCFSTATRSIPPLGCAFKCTTDNSVFIKGVHTEPCNCKPTTISEVTVDNDPCPTSSPCGTFATGFGLISTTREGCPKSARAIDGPTAAAAAGVTPIAMMY